MANQYGSSDPITAGDVYDRYLRKPMTPEEGNPLGLKTGDEGTISVQDYNKRLMADIAKGPDKTVSGMLVGIGNRFSAIDGMIRNRDFRSAEAADKQLLSDIAPYQESIVAYASLDDTLCPKGSPAEAIRATARRLVLQSDADRAVRLPDGSDFRYGDLRNPEAVRQYDIGVGNTLNMAGYSDGAQKLATGNVAGYAFDNPELARASSDRAIKFMASLTANDLTANKRGVSLTGAPGNEAATAVAAAVADGKWKDYDDTFGDYLVNVASVARGQFLDGGAGPMMSAALHIGRNLARRYSDKQQVASETANVLRSIYGAVHKSASGDTSGPSTNYGAYAGYAAAVSAIAEIAGSGQDVDFSSPDFMNAVGGVAELSARMSAAGIDLFRSLRNSGYNVKKELGAQCLPAFGWRMPSSVIDNARTLMADNTFLGSSAFAQTPQSRSTRVADYDAQRKSGGSSGAALADQLAANLNDIKKRHIWSEAVSSGVTVGDAWSKITSDSSKASNYVWDISQEIRNNLPGSEADRTAGARALVRAAFDSSVPLIDYARGLVNDPSFKRGNPGAYRAISGWLASAEDNDPELAHIREMLFAQAAAGGADSSEASGSVTRTFSMLQQMRATGGDWRTAALKLLGRIALPSKNSDGRLVPQVGSIFDHAGESLTVGNRVFNIPPNLSLETAYRIAAEINNAAATWSNTEDAVNLYRGKQDAKPD